MMSDGAETGSVGHDAACVAVRTLGCKVNRAESEVIIAELIARGATIVEPDDADVVVVDSCTVTGEADAKTRKAVRRAARARRRPWVVVTGCMAALDSTALAELDERVVVIADKSAVSDHVASLARLRPAAGPAPRVGAPFRTRALVKLQDGCDSRCAYCVVPSARGDGRSEPLSDVVQQVARLVDLGTAEVVLTGVNLGRYRDGGDDLAAAIRAVAETGVVRLRLSSVEPLDVSETLLEALAETPAVCAHLHVPLQSGSDTVLRSMRRNYDTNEYIERISLARRVLPGLAVTTDVMAGFPGETEADAARTRAVCEELGFAKLHVFRYSERAGTAAAKLTLSVSPDDRSRRAAELRRLGEALSTRHLESALGSVAEVLVESVGSGEGMAWAEGTTRTYERVRFASASATPGDVAAVVPRAVVGERLEGDAQRDRIDRREQGRRERITTASRNGTEVR
jgi:threonylcarbamoyladenosine tRNA methylthiotransferase MtaB